MSLRNSMWHDLRNGIIMRDVMYAEWLKEINLTKKNVFAKAYITYRTIMPFRNSYHLPCRKLFPPFTLTPPKWTKIKNKKPHVRSVKNCCFSPLNMQISCRRRRNGWLISSLITNCGIHVANVLAPKGWIPWSLRFEIGCWFNAAHSEWEIPVF